MQIKYWKNFSKRKNSTKIPTGGTTVDVALKDGADWENPIFDLVGHDIDINYVSAFGNYYFCDTQNLDGHHIRLNCELDPLATYKTQIQAYTGFVEFTSSSSNLLITDPRNQPSISVYPASSYSDLSWTTDSDGTYVFGVIGMNGGSTGMTTFYSMNKASFLLAMTEIFDPSIVADLVNDFNGVQNCLVSCYWTPLSRSWVNSKFSGINEAIQIGRASGITAQGYKLISRTYTESDDIDVPYPASAPFTTKSYLRKSPYITGNVYLPFVGCVPLDCDICADDPRLKTTMTLDILTGDIVYYIQHKGVNTIIGTYSGNCASKIPVSGASYDSVGVVRASVSTVAGLVSGIAGNPAGFASATSGALNLTESLAMHSQSGGSISSACGGIYGPSTQLTINTFSSLPAETNLTSWQTEQGMPYYKKATLSSLSGFIKCSNASVDIPGTSADKAAVNEYLNSGFYLE